MVTLVRHNWLLLRTKPSSFRYPEVAAKIIEVTAALGSSHKPELAESKTSQGDVHPDDPSLVEIRLIITV